MASSNDNSSQRVSLRRRVFSFPTLLAFAVAGAFVVFLATRFDLDWDATWDNVRSMNPWLYLVAFVLYYTSFVFRGLRWRMLAQNAVGKESATGRLPPASECAQFILIGWFVNSITWLRLGDAYRAYAFAEASERGFSWSLGTILAERVLDMATVFGLLMVGAVAFTLTSGSAVSGYILVAASSMAFGLVALTFLMKVYGTRVARFFPRRMEAAYRPFHQGTLGSFKHLPYLLALSLMGWLLEIGRLYFVVQALGVSIGLPLVPVVALGHGILSAVPTPGGLGAVEPGITGLLLLGLKWHDAVSVALVDRSITYISVLLIGGLVFLLRQLAQGRRTRRRALAARGVSQHGNAADA